MPLESLLALVEKLRERIDDHGPALRQNEALTRYVLIDPLLRELGWDTENPALVIPEYKGVGGSADYALFNGDKPLMIVEAKKLDTSLRNEKVLTQGLAYCQRQGTRYLSVTDGRRWEIYETHKLASIDEKRMVEFDLKNQSATDACLKALTLWELRVSNQVATSPEYRTPNTQTTPGSDKQKWQSLSELNPQRGSRSPVEIQFPDNSVVSVTTWRSLLAKVATWLIDNNHLTKSHCPIRKTTRGTRYIVHTEPFHASGRPFGASLQVESLYVHRHGGNVYSTKACRTIVKHVGQDPAQFKVRFSPP